MILFFDILHDRVFSEGQSKKIWNTIVNGTTTVWLTKQHVTSAKNAASENVSLLAWQQIVSDIQ